MSELEELDSQIRYNLSVCHNLLQRRTKRFENENDRIHALLNELGDLIPLYQEFLKQKALLKKLEALIESLEDEDVEAAAEYME